MVPLADAVRARPWHAEAMTLAIHAQLAVLALIDSTSIGTLLIPLWLMLRPDARRIVPRILLYLGVLAGFYFLVGIAALSGADWILNGLGEQSLTAVPVVQWAMVLGGGGMLAFAFRPDPAKKARKQAVLAGPDGQSSPAPGSPEVKWRTRLSRALYSPGGLLGLALVAGLLELPTMLPYLVAIGLISHSTLALPGEISVLALYCLVMLLPAVLLLALRASLGARLDPLFQWLNHKLGKFAGETLLWVLGIVGFLLLRAGLAALAPTAAWNPFT